MAEFPKFGAADQAAVLSIALIGPDEARRRAIANALSGNWDTESQDPKSSGIPGSPTSLNGVNGFKAHEDPLSLDGQNHQGSDNGADPQDLPGARYERILLAGVNAPARAREHVVREFSSYPPSLDDPSQVLDQHYDVVIVDLESDPEYALEVVRTISDDGFSTVMVYSSKTDRNMVVRCMRVGAREYLALPLAPADMADALARVVIRRPAAAAFATKKAAGRLFVFLGTKGGCGVTTLASNFAVALAQESGEKTLLIDLGIPLGDAAINLGITSDYSTDNAFHNAGRLDAKFLLSLLATHSTGLAVLAAPQDAPSEQAPRDAIDKLISVAREEFDYVVVDVGSRLDLKESAIFDLSATFYLITQVGVSELRNANRMITRFFANRANGLQIVLNRFTPRALLFDETDVTKALTKPPQWKIPDDFAAARRTLNTATPLVMDDSPIAVSIRQMARKACGLSPEVEEKKKGFSLFGRR
jgi:pilus assembly protein CpaE